MTAHTKFVIILSSCSLDIERKRNYEGQTVQPIDGLNDRQPKSSKVGL